MLKLPRLFVFLAVICLFSCSTQFHKDIVEANKLFNQMKFKDAARKLLPSANSSGRDQLLAQMECGTMLNVALDYENSNKLFLSAGELAKKIPISISQESIALLTNDTKTNYRGEDFERVLIHMYAGMNFLMLDQNDSARVEFKRVNDLLTSFKSEGLNQFKQNIMAKYLTAVAFEAVADASNDTDDLEYAYIEMKQIYQLDPSNPLVKRDLVRLSGKLKYDDEYQTWKARFGNYADSPSQVVVIFQNGMSPIKVSRGKILDDESMRIALRLAFDSASLKTKEGVTFAAILAVLATVENPIPKYQRRSAKSDYLTLEIDGVEKARSYMLENIADTSLKTLEEKYTTIKTKVAAGIVVKAITAVIAGKIAKEIAQTSKKTKGVAGLIGAITGGIVGAGLIMQIEPDLRCWSTLPANFQLALAGIDPGKHNVKVKFYANSEVISEKDLGDFDIPAKKKFIINCRTVN